MWASIHVCDHIMSSVVNTAESWNTIPDARNKPAFRSLIEMEIGVCLLAFILTGDVCARWTGCCARVRHEILGRHAQRSVFSADGPMIIAAWVIVPMWTGISLRSDVTTHVLNAATVWHPIPIARHETSARNDAERVAKKLVCCFTMESRDNL